MKFKSKIDWWFYLVVFGFTAVAALMIYESIIDKFIVIKIVTSAILLIYFLLVLPVYLSTYYILEEKTLYIRCGFLNSERIPYSYIVSIEETRDATASAAPSLDRIGIEFREYSSINDYTKNYIMISPESKQKFISELLKRNTHIRFKNNII